MFNNIYVKLKKFIKENLWFFIVLTIIVAINFIKVPYEVMMPGGTIDLTDRVVVAGEEVELEGSFNMAYVSVVQGSIPYVIVGSVLPDWDVEKMDTDDYDKEEVEAENMGNRLQLINSKNAAKEVAFRTAGVPYNLGEEYTYVYDITDEANTTLKVGDDIQSVNGIVINHVDELSSLLKQYKKGDKLSIVVIRDGKEKEVSATLYADDKGDAKIGISVLTTAEVTSDVDIEINTTDSESGPSGGMMMALMLYNALTEQDLTHGKKIVGTGTIERDGSVGIIGGVKYKVMGAEKNGADVFLVPEGNYKAALAVKEEKGYDIEIVSVKTLDDAIKYLEGLE